MLCNSNHCETSLNRHTLGSDNCGALSELTVQTNYFIHIHCIIKLDMFICTDPGIGTYL